MQPLGTRSVGSSPRSSGSMPVSNSSRVNLSLRPGGCGSIIPKFNLAKEGRSERAFRKDPVWCGMKSESLPGHYFLCSECLGHIDQE